MAFGGFAYPDEHNLVKSLLTMAIISATFNLAD